MSPVDVSLLEDGFDVVGDVHGCAAHLHALLAKLGYSDERGWYAHPRRRVVFVGDLIDRGPTQVEVVSVVRKMVEHGSAVVVAGNHEYNAVNFATSDPERAGEFLRPHSDRNVGQHREFISQVGGFGTQLHRELIAWFKTLPLWWESDGLRVVHACWHQGSIDTVEAVNGSPVLSDSCRALSARRDSSLFDAVEVLCKGVEAPLPAGVVFQDKDGIVRRKARVRWWDPAASTLMSALELLDGCDIDPQVPYVAEPVYTSEVPVLFGHYWQRWPQLTCSPVAGCVDYSAVRGGPLVAYRWSGERTLSPGRFVAAHPD